MSMTDPISDMLTRIRNGIMSRKARVEMPYSRIKGHIATILVEEGFVADAVEVQGKHPQLLVELKWTTDHRPAIVGIRRISKPGQRRYVGKQSIPIVRGGQGIAILTTSRGVMSDRTARSQHIGGEVLCEVW